MIEQVYDEDKLKQDKKLGVVALPLKSLQHDALTELSLNLLSSLDTLKVKDKKDRGTLTIKVSFFAFLISLVK
jgi:Ca2+-dependent lipid-binding protein